MRLEDDWVPMDEQLGTAELEEVLRAKEAHSSAVVLESVRPKYFDPIFVFININFCLKLRMHYVLFIPLCCRLGIFLTLR